MSLGKIIAERKNKKIYVDGDKVIKVFDPEFSKADVLNEALNQARVESTDLHIPKLINVGKVEDKWTITMDYIEGKTLEQIMKEDSKNLDKHLEFFVDLQMTVHAQKAPLLNKITDKMKRKISESPIDEETKYNLHTRLNGMPKHSKVCHGDFNPSNIIISKDGTPYIIDWSHATQGNASADVARSYLLFSLNYSKEIADKYLDLFAKKSNTEKQYILKWIPIVAASQLVKGKENEREFLLRWTDVVEYE